LAEKPAATTKKRSAANLLDGADLQLKRQSSITKMSANEGGGSGSGSGNSDTALSQVFSSVLKSGQGENRLLERQVWETTQAQIRSITANNYNKEVEFFKLKLLVEANFMVARALAQI